jgi:3-methyladenine DNA glycosylase AlkD
MSIGMAKIPASAKAIRRDLCAIADSKKAAFYPSFFKTGAGEYAEGDIFLGVSVPAVRSVVRRYRELPGDEIILLLADPLHECRLAALLILVDQFTRAKDEEKKSIVDLYLQQLDRVNNWDLVDTSAAAILGEYLVTRPRNVLYALANSKHLWRERISIVATLAFIRRNDFEDTIALCTHFLTHTHDLMHKACGWMLREVAKRDMRAINSFLDVHAAHMPRTMLRYCLEKHPSSERRRYMSIKKQKN